MSDSDESKSQVNRLGVPLILSSQDVNLESLKVFF